MSQLRYLFLVCSIAFFACTNDVAGTWEDENTVAQQSSSSAAESLSSSAIDTIPFITSSSYTIYVVIEQYGGNDGGYGKWKGCGIDLTEYKSAIVTTSSISVSSSATTLITENKGGSTISSSSTSTKSYLITLNNILEGRIAELTKSGLSESVAYNTAKWELFNAIGIDTLLQAYPQIESYMINDALDYIFGGTTQSEFYKDLKATFAQTGTLEKKYYCNFDNLRNFRDESYPQLLANTYPRNVFPNYILYDNSAYTPKGCASWMLRPIPPSLVNNVARKCFDIPYCTSALKDSIRIGEYRTDSIGIGNIRFICRDFGWDKPTEKEVYTYQKPCNKEGKYIGTARVDSVYACSLDSGWYKAETIDIATRNEPCDKHGKLINNPDHQHITYVCRKEPFCRHHDSYTTNAPCMDEGWDYASKNDIEMSKVECNSDGQTLPSSREVNLYYVCQDGKWSEFYNRPCDTDNKRIKLRDYDNHVTGFIEYICYNKTWRPTYEWHTDYPAEYYFNPEIDYGRFKDPRDNYVYHTLDFKGKTWIVENMKYAGFPDSVLTKETRCLEDSCKNVGRYYSVNVAGEVCPEGWNLPDSSDIADIGPIDSSSAVVTSSNFWHVFSQLGSTGSAYTTPDTYGLSFIATGRIIDTTEILYSPWQGYITMMWMNEIDSEGNRRFIEIKPYGTKTYWYKKPDTTYTRIQPPDYDPSSSLYKSYFTIRCIKK